MFNFRFHRCWFVGCSIQLDVLLPSALIASPIQQLVTVHHVPPFQLSLHPTFPSSACSVKPPTTFLCPIPLCATLTRLLPRPMQWEVRWA